MSRLCFTRKTRLKKPLITVLVGIGCFGIQAASLPVFSASLSKETKQAQRPQLEARLLVLLTPTDAHRPNAENMSKLQQGHLANLRKIAETGLLLVAGPTQSVQGSSQALSGVLIFKSSDPDSSQRILEMLSDDPMIKAGVLEYQSYSFMFEHGDNLYERRERIVNNGAG